MVKQMIFVEQKDSMLKRYASLIFLPLQRGFDRLSYSFVVFQRAVPLCL